MPGGVHWPEVNPALGSGRHLHRRLIFFELLSPDYGIFRIQAPTTSAATTSNRPALSSLESSPTPHPTSRTHPPPRRPPLHTRDNGLPRHNPSRPDWLPRPRPRLRRSLQAGRRLVAVPTRASQGGHQPDRGARVGGGGHDARGGVQDPQRQAAAGRPGQHGGRHGALQAAV